MSRSTLDTPLSKRLLMALSLAIVTAVPTTANAFSATPQTATFNGAALSQTNKSQQWLVADRKDDKDEKKDRDDDRG